MIESNDYEWLLNKMIFNTITKLSDIIGICQRNLSDFTEMNGYSISAVSRLRNKVKKSLKSAKSDLPYAVSMLNGLDSIYLFERLSEEKRDEINKLIFDGMCDNVYLFTDNRGEDQYGDSLINQEWYRVEWRNNKGFLFQLQHFIHMIEVSKKTDQTIEEKSQVFQLMKNAKVAFTVPAYNTHYDDLDNINEALNKRYFEEDIFKIFVSKLVEKQNFYSKKDFNYPDFIKICEMKDEVKKYFKDSPDYIKDIIIILDELFTFDKIDKIEDALLLFLSDEDELRIIQEVFRRVKLKLKVIYAYKKYIVEEKKVKLVLDSNGVILKFRFVDPISIMEEFIIEEI